MAALHAADCAAFLLLSETVVVVILVFGLVSVFGALVGEVALFLAAVANLLVVSRIFAVVVWSLAFWAIRSEVAFFTAAETSELPSLRLLRLVFLLVLVLAVIRAVARLLAMVTNHPFALWRRTRLVESLWLFSLVLPIGAIVQEMTWFPAAIAYNAWHIGNCVILVIIVGLIRLIALLLSSVPHLYLGKVLVVTHRMADFLEPSILHLLEVVEDRSDLK